jgi:hypothetical protein
LATVWLQLATAPAGVECLRRPPECPPIALPFSRATRPRTAAAPSMAKSPSAWAAGACWQGRVRACWGPGRNAPPERSPSGFAVRTRLSHLRPDLQVSRLGPPVPTALPAPGAPGPARVPQTLLALATGSGRMAAGPGRRRCANGQRVSEAVRPRPPTPASRRPR